MDSREVRRERARAKALSRSRVKKERRLDLASKGVGGVAVKQRVCRFVVPRRLVKAVAVWEGEGC